MPILPLRLLAKSSQLKSVSFNPKLPPIQCRTTSIFDHWSKISLVSIFILSESIKSSLKKICFVESLNNFFKSSIFFSERATTAKFAPFFSKAIAASLPRPLDAPVTSIFLFKKGLTLFKTSSKLSTLGGLILKLLLHYKNFFSP